MIGGSNSMITPGRGSNSIIQQSQHLDTVVSSNSKDVDKTLKVANDSNRGDFVLNVL